MPDLNSRLIFNNVSSELNENRLEGILTLKFNYNSVNDLMKDIGNWQGTDAEKQWLADMVYYFDNKVDATRPVNLTYIRYRDSVHDDAPAVVVVAKYDQEQEGVDSGSSNIRSDS